MTLLSSRAGLMLVLALVRPVFAEELSSLPQPATSLKLLPGFKAELLLEVPRDFASWISLTVDPQGRLIVSDQGNRMLRITPAALGQNGSETTVERLQLGVGGAHGLLYWSGYLYVVTGSKSPETGVFRLADLDGRGSFGEPELLLKIPGGGEHGPHGIVAGPQGDWLYLIAGNATAVPASLTHNHVVSINPTRKRTVPKPQGWVLRISPDGKRRELFAQGLRNSYDLAFNEQGELFTYDSDNEGFHGLPWYRPTNVYHLVRGADYGWRQSPENLMSYYPDNPPPVIEVGPGSPTGLVCGTSTHFPEKYRRALFACDWSYGRIYAINLQPDGATWQAQTETFVSGQPLPTTDIAVGRDGAVYFLTGGRGTPAALYRVYAEQPDRAEIAASEVHPRAVLRRQLEQLDGSEAASLEFIWENLAADDRAVRYAARAALERQPIPRWQDRVFVEQNLQTQLESLIAAARLWEMGNSDRLLAAADRLDWSTLTKPRRHALLRIYGLVLERMGAGTRQTADRTAQRLSRLFPCGDEELDRELAKLLHAINSEHPGVVVDLESRTLDLLDSAPTLMEQIHYLQLVVTDDMSPDIVARLQKCLDQGELRAIALRPYAQQQQVFQDLLAQLKIDSSDSEEVAPREVVQQWKLADLKPLLQGDTLKHADLTNGKAVYRTARCANCHRLGTTGGVLGPALNGVSRRYSKEVILESIVQPSKVIAEQYRMHAFHLKDGRVLTGNIVNLSAKGYQVQTDPFRAFARTTVALDAVEQIEASAVSLMPAELLNTFKQEEIRDLLAYLIAAGAN